MRDFLQSFSQISSSEWVEILILLGIATLIGYIIGWLLRSFKVKRLQRLLNERTQQYDSLNKVHREKLGFMNEIEAENDEMTNRITILNDEIKSLKLKLANNQSAGILVDNDTTALVINEDGEPAEIETSGKLGWLQRVRNAFSKNNGLVELESDNEISIEEKLQASNNMIERLLSSNEKIEDENERLKLNIANLQEGISADKNIAPVSTEPKIVKEIDTEKVNQYTNSLKDAKTTGKDLLKRIEELEIYNGKIIKQLETETKEKAVAQQKLIESGDYKTKYLDLAPKFETTEIDNNKLKAELSQLKPNTENDSLKTELKIKEDALAICNNEKQALSIKLEDASKALTNCNEQQQGLKTKLEEAVNKNKAIHTQKTAVVTPTPLTEKPLEVKSVVKEKPVETKEKPALETSHDIMTRIKNKAKSIDFSRIGIGNVGAKDDLKEIKGIGEFVESKLNALGIYHFKQLANLTEDDMDKVNDAIEFFPGRIKRDNWVEQAKKLASS